MKNLRLKNYLKFGILIIGVSLLFTTCEKEDASEEIIQTDDQATDLVLKHFSRKDIEGNPKLVSKLGEFNDKLARNKSAKFSDASIYNSEYDFTIHTDTATYIQNGDYHSYTFPIVQGDDDKIINVLFELNDKKEYDAFLVEYDYSANELKYQDLNSLSLRTSMKPIDLDFNSLFARTSTAYFCIYTYKYIDDGELRGAGNEVYVWVLTGSYCETVYYYDEDYIRHQEGNSATVTIGGTTYGGTGGSKTSPMPSLFDREELMKINVVKDKLNLRNNYDSWINSHGWKVFEIYDYLVINLFFKEAIDFAKSGFMALMNDGEVDFEEKRINGIKLDDSLPACLNSIILDLMLGNFPYSDTMGNIDLIDDTFSELGNSYSPNSIGIVVTYKAGEISGNGETAGTGYDAATQTINISITISNNLINNGTKLAITKTILHESIHAYLLKIKFLYPTFFGSSNEFSQLALDYRNYSNNNDADHTYMSNIIANISSNISNFVQEKYSYPTSSSAYYEAVSWSGLTHLTNGSINPLFSDNYPNNDDQNNIIKIFNTENGTASYPGYSPLINNNCN